MTAAASAPVAVPAAVVVTLLEELRTLGLVVGTARERLTAGEIAQADAALENAAGAALVLVEAIGVRVGCAGTADALTFELYRREE